MPRFSRPVTAGGLISRRSDRTGGRLVPLSASDTSPTHSVSATPAQQASHLVCRPSPVVRRLSFVVRRRRPSSVVRCVASVVCCLPFVCRLSSVIRLSRVACCPSSVVHRLLFVGHCLPSVVCCRSSIIFYLLSAVSSVVRRLLGLSAVIRSSALLPCLLPLILLFR